MSEENANPAPTEAEPQSALQLEKAMLQELNEKPVATRFLGYVKLSGPGWLQSALTLGGGSLASGLYLGVLTGYSLLWLQPFAMILGIIMLASLSYLTLSTGERPFRAINKHVSPVLGWGWLIGSMMANMVWALPQYSLASAAIQQNLMPGLFGAEGALAGDTGKYVIVLGILIFCTLITWSYGSGHWGVRLYERILKIIVALIVFCFIGVVARMLFIDESMSLGEVLSGFIPSWSSLVDPPAKYQELLAAIAPENRETWLAYIENQQRDTAMAAFATAVGINMTFLLAYSLLGRGWGKEHRTLSIFDLSTGMFIPFLLATSCVVIAAASQFHSVPYPGLLEAVQSEEALIQEIQNSTEERNQEEELKSFKAGLPKNVGKALGGYHGILDKQTEGRDATEQEKALAITLVKRDAFDLSRALEPLLQGRLFSNIVFGLGVLAMALSTISLLMLISGFVVCELLDVPTEGWPFRLGTMAAATGALGPFVWSDAAFYLAVPTSVFGLVLLPIAYASFFFLINSKSYMGEESLKGTKLIVWNVLMFIATGTAIVASGWAVWVKRHDIIKFLDWISFDIF